MYRLAYLAVLLGGLGGLAVLDRHFRLAWWNNPRRTGLVLGAALVVFLAWDELGILNHSFAAGNSPWASGIMLMPNLPLEEPVFLLLLCYQTLILWIALSRWRRV